MAYLKSVLVVKTYQSPKSRKVAPIPHRIFSVICDAYLNSPIQFYLPHKRTCYCGFNILKPGGELTQCSRILCGIISPRLYESFAPGLILSLVVIFTSNNRESAIELLEQDNARQFVRKSHR